jgi:hypothetical protein
VAAGVPTASATTAASTDSTANTALLGRDDLGNTMHLFRSW